MLVVFVGDGTEGPAGVTFQKCYKLYKLGGLFCQLPKMMKEFLLWQKMGK